MNKRIVAFGEVMLRLTPPDHKLMAEATSFDACYGGSEGNVLVGLSAMGHDTALITAVPDNSIGNALIRTMRSHGVNCDDVIMKGDRLGMYFLEEGFGSRNANVVYCRKDSEVSRLAPGAFDLDEVFRDCGLFHISGISFALSESCRALCFELVNGARERGIPVSFDFNYRGKLWSIEQAGEVFRQILPLVDIVFAADRDLTAFLKTDRKHFFENYHPRYLILRGRDILEFGNQKIMAEIWENDNGVITHYERNDVAFPVLERIGGGDAFSVGVLHGILSGWENSKSLTFGMACHVMKHTVKGDMMTFSESQVINFFNNLTQDVCR